MIIQTWQRDIEEIGKNWGIVQIDQLGNKPDFNCRCNMLHPRGKYKHPDKMIQQLEEHKGTFIYESSEVMYLDMFKNEKAYLMLYFMRHIHFSQYTKYFFISALYNPVPRRIIKKVIRHYEDAITLREFEVFLNEKGEESIKPIKIQLEKFNFMLDTINKTREKCKEKNVRMNNYTCDVIHALKRIKKLYGG